MVTGRRDAYGRWLYGALCALLASLAAPVPAVAQTGLFESDEPLAFTLAFDMRELCRADAAADCPDTSGTLTYTGDDGAEHGLTVRIRTRGRWRNVAANCSMPPLSIVFDRPTAQGTLFAGQTMLPLTTHCNERPPSQEQYVLKELLAYHIYNELTDKSLRVRLVRVTYQETGRRPRVVQRYAFFTEHFASLAARNGAEYWPTESFDPGTADAGELAGLDLFEFMIGNTDWSALKGHNIAHLRFPNQLVTAIPYDFDFSGLVNASYATPPPGVRINRVTQRLYRGLCYPGLDWAALFRRFEDRREAIGAAVEHSPALSDDQRTEARDYVASFYAIIGSEEKRQKTIIEKCRPLDDRS